MEIETQQRLKIQKEDGEYFSKLFNLENKQILDEAKKKGQC